MEETRWYPWAQGLILALALAACGGDNFPADSTTPDDTALPSGDMAPPDPDLSTNSDCADPSWDIQPPDFPVLTDATQACLPNEDGIIEAVELPVVFGAQAHYRVNPPGLPRVVDLEGEVDGEGRHVWDMSASAGDDVDLLIEPLPVESFWFAPHFPEASYAGRLSAASDTLGVYRATDGAVELMGIASEAPDETLAIYDYPITIFAFPLHVGAQWVSEGIITDGHVQGLPLASRDTYRAEVDGVGTLKLAQLTFNNVLRLRLEVTQEPVAGSTLRQIQYVFLYECYGEVARVVSQYGEMEDNFTVASELRRLGF